MPDGELSVVKSGKKTELEWKVNNFSQNEQCYRSPDFKFEGESWYLDLLPNYIHGAFINLRLLKSSNVSRIEVDFCVSVKTTNGMKNFERRKIDIFSRYTTSSTILQWIRRTEFSNRQRELLSSGCLTILLTMQKADTEESETASATAACSCCKGSIHEDKISFHKDCLNKETKCPKCDEIISLQNYFDHVCQTANVSGKSSTSHPCGSQIRNDILHDLKQLLLNQEKCDVLLKVRGKEFSAHQAILVARSPVLAAIFRSNTKEKETGTVDIEDIDPSCFPEFLCFLYCGELDKVSAENVRSLFAAADKYEIRDLRMMCLVFMKENLCVDTFCETLALAVLHSETELINSCTDYFVQNAVDIIETDKWKSFATENPTESTELFTKYVKSSHEMRVHNQAKRLKKC